MIDPSNYPVFGKQYVKKGFTATEKPLKIAGLGGVYAPTDYPEFRKDLRHPRHYTQGEVEECCKMKGASILLTHEPPKGYADEKRGIHMGTKPILSILESVKPRYHICGHIHKQQLDMFEGTTVINCGYGVSGDYCIIDTNDNLVEFYSNFRLINVVDLINKDI